MAMLEAFVHDPLINWRLLNTTTDAVDAGNTPTADSSKCFNCALLVHLFVRFLIHASIHPFIHPPIHPSTHPSIHACIHPSVHSSIHSFDQCLPLGAVLSLHAVRLLS